MILAVGMALEMAPTIITELVVAVALLLFWFSSVVVVSAGNGEGGDGAGGGGGQGGKHDIGFVISVVVVMVVFRGRSAIETVSVCSLRA